MSGSDFENGGGKKRKAAAKFKLTRYCHCCSEPFRPQPEHFYRILANTETSKTQPERG